MKSKKQQPNRTDLPQYDKLDALITSFFGDIKEEEQTLFEDVVEQLADSINNCLKSDPFWIKKALNDISYNSSILSLCNLFAASIFSKYPEEARHYIPNKIVLQNCYKNNNNELLTVYATNNTYTSKTTRPNTLKNFDFINLKSLDLTSKAIQKINPDDKRTEAIDYIKNNISNFKLERVNDRQILELEELKNKCHNFSEVIDYILLSLKSKYFYGDKSINFGNIMIEGEPGTGKNFFINRLSEILNTPLHLVSCNQGQLRPFTDGTHPSYKDSCASGLIQNIVSHKTCNPIIALDELDHALKGDTIFGMGTLLSLLEKETNIKWSDTWYDIEFNVSNVNWIALTNDISLIPNNILSRFKIFKVNNINQSHEEISDIIKDIIANDFSSLPFELPRIASDKFVARIKSLNLGQREIRREIEIALHKYAISKFELRDSDLPKIICVESQYNNDTNIRRNNKGIGFMAEI